MYASTSSIWHHITKNFMAVCPYTYFTHTSTSSHLFPELVLFWWGNLRERDHSEDPGVDGRITLRWIFRRWDVGVCIGLSWLGIGRGGGLFLMRQ